MARKAKKRTNEKLAQKFPFDPIEFFLRVMAAIGRPVYLLLSSLFIVLIFTLAVVVAFFSASLNKFKKSLKKTRKRIKKIKTRIRSISLPNLITPESKKAIRLEELKIFLLPLKIVYKLKKLLSKKFSRLQKFRIRITVSVMSIVIILAASFFLFYFYIIRTLPSPSELSQKSLPVSTKIYDRNGTLLYKIYKDQNRTIVPLSQIPVHVRLATLAAEDAEFYDHPGFSIKGITRAVIQDVKTGSLQGGSTKKFS